MSVPSPAPIKPAINHPLNVIVATDCGSTTTKAILIEKVGDDTGKPIAAKRRRRSKRRSKM